MSLVLLALAAAFKIIGDSKNIKQTVPILAMMAAIIAVLGVSMIFLAMMPWQQSLAAAGSMSLVLLALAAAFKIIGDSKKIKQTVPILAMMVAIIGAIGLVLAILSLMPITNAAVAAAALSITLLALAGAMKILSTMQSIQPTVIVALMVMVAAIAVIGTVMSLLGGMGGGAMITALVGIAGALVILVVALNLMNGTLAGSAALLIAAAALVVLAQALIMLGGLSWGQLLIGLVAIAGVLAILGVAGLLLGPVVPVIAALAAAIALLGVAFLAIGAGALLFGMAMNVIATAFPAMTAALTANAPAFVQGLAVIIQGLIAMIPMIVQGIGQGIITFCGVIVAAAPSVAQAFLAVLKAILDVIVGAAPMIIQAGIDLIVAFLNGIAQGLPRIIQAAFDLVIAFINGLADGIRNNTPKVTAAVRNLIDAILSAGKTILKDMLGLGGDLVGKLATGIKNAFGKAVQAAKDLGKKVLDGIKNFLGIHSPSTKFAEIGKNMVDGLINGIKNIIPNAIKAVKNLGSSVLNAICKVLGINSPSKEFAEIGEFSGLGFAEGLLGTSGTVNTAAEGVAGGALDSFRSVFSSADGSIDLGNLFNTDSVTPEGLVIDTDGIVGIGKGTTDSEKVEELQKVINYALEEAGVTDADGNIVQITVDGDWLDETQKYYEWFEEEWGLTADGFLSEEDVKTIEKRLEQIDDVAKKSADSTEPITQEEYDQKVADRGTNKTSILNDAAYQVYKDEANTALDAAEDVNDAEKKLAEAGLKHTEALNELDEANEVGNSARIKNAESAVESAKEIYGQAAEDLATAKNARDEAYEELNESYADLKGRLEPYLTDEILDKYMAASEHDKEMFNAALQEGLKALNQDGIITDEEISGLMSALDEGILSNEAREKAQYISAEFYSFLEDYMAKYHPELDMSKMTVADWDELLTIPELNRIQSEWYDDARYCTDGFIGGFMRGMDSHVTDMVELATLPSDIFATVNNIKSPSKVFEELGSYLVQGLLVGLSTYKKDVPGTVSEIGKTIQNLFGIVDPDMDIQPTITPVLDLSNIERDAPWLTSGSYTLQLATAGASSSSSSISTMMNQRGQNGNEDVVSAIDKLGAGLHDDIAGIDANVYNIKGITYNDENGITNAIKQIVKQVIREGRS